MNVKKLTYICLSQATNILYRSFVFCLDFAKKNEYISRVRLKDLRLVALIVPFCIVMISTSVPNAITFFALQLLFSGIIARVIFEKLGIQYVQFDKYRKDIEKVARQRQLIITLCLVATGVLLCIILSNYDIVQHGSL